MTDPEQDKLKHNSAGSDNFARSEIGRASARLKEARTMDGPRQIGQRGEEP